MTTDSNKTFTFTLKEILATVWFILMLGFSIGGFVKVVNDVEGLTTKVDKISNDLTDLKVENGKLETLIKGTGAIK